MEADTLFLVCSVHPLHTLYKQICRVFVILQAENFTKNIVQQMRLRYTINERK